MPQIRVYLSEDNETVHDLGEETTTVGRVEDNTIQIEDASVSSHHAEIVFENGSYRLQDKGSTNGTFLNGAPATDATLKNGDKVRFGSIETVFAGEVAGDSQPLPKTERAVVSLGGGSARPVGFVNSSPFPKPKEKTDRLTMAAIVLAALGVVGFVASIALTLTLQAPA